MPAVSLPWPVCLGKGVHRIVSKWHVSQETVMGTETGFDTSRTLFAEVTGKRGYSFQAVNCTCFKTALKVIGSQHKLDSHAFVKCMSLFMGCIPIKTNSSVSN